MDSTINLLPERDKQLKREGQPQPSKEMVEMTKPQDRVFQERVVRMEGVLAFFKKMFRRAPTLPEPKAKVVTPAAPPKPAPAPAAPAAPVTKLETMSDRMHGVPPVPKPPVPPPTGNFFTKLFNRDEKPKPPVGSFRPPLAVPPPPKPATPAPAPAPVRRVSAWAPPPPPGRPIAPPPAPPARGPVSAAPASKPPLGPVPIPAVPPPRVRPASGSTDAQPLLGNSLNVNLVPEQYQPEASVRDRLLAGSFVGGAILLVAGATLGLYLYQQRLQTKVASVDEQTLQVNQEIASRERDDLGDALVLQQRTSDVKRVLDQHVYWDAFFQKLESVTLPSVAYSSMSVDVAGSVTLAATAKTYDDVGSQLLTYQRAKDFITDVTISSATKVSTPAAASQSSTPPGQTAQASQPLVSFSVAMRVDPALFYRR